MGAAEARDRLWNNRSELTKDLLGKLDRRERFVIRCRYALGSHRQQRTFQFLADKLGVSKERARQLERRALDKLKTMVACLDLDELTGTLRGS